MKRKSLLLAAVALSTAAALPLATTTATATTTAASSTADPVLALTRAGHPLLSTKPGGNLTDLRPLTRMVGNAQVVGIGEATHNSSEFFTLKHRIFQALVEQKGFTAFALEGAWSTGLALNRYVVDGTGDPREIMDREFQGSYEFWNTEEYLALIEWMRSYNQTHARKLHFVGDDVGYVGSDTINQVTDYVRATKPSLLPELTRLYSGLPTEAQVAPWTDAYLAKPPAARQQLAKDAWQAVVLVQNLPPSSDRTWAQQNARAAWQVTKFLSYALDDPNVLPQAMKFRDQMMAENVTWWTRHTGDKVVLSAHNGHIAYKSSMPSQYPKLQGEFLREQLGSRYLNIGLSFDHGSFNARNIEDPQGAMKTFTIGSAATGNNEYTLDKVPYRDYFVDLRTLPRSTRNWLQVERPTRDIGTAYPFPDSPVALAPSYDLLIHLNKVTAAHLR
jgi:erythromycin esterase